MNDAQREAVLTISLLAAFADGVKSEPERAQVRRVAERLAGEGVDLTRALERVLLRQTGIREEARLLAEPAHRTLAYEMAVVMCEADGVISEAERRFLDELGAALAIESSTRAAAVAQADAIASAPPDAPTESSAADAAATEAQIDSMVLRYAVVNAALELLPQNLSTLAILPLQTKMVYRIGRRYGHSLDRRSIGEFLAVLGIGATSQMLENVARKFLGGLGKAILGGLGKSVANSATGAAFTFGTTYALGQVAKSYYAGGRTLNTADLKARFSSLLEQGKALFDRHRGAVEQQAGSMNSAQVMDMVRHGL